MRRRLLFIILMSVVLIGSSILPVLAQDEQPKPGGKLTLTVTSITHLDPCSIAQENELYPLVYEGLFELDKDLNPTPLLAKSFEISEDGLTHTIHLQEGVTFDDGTPFNADVAKWNLDRKIDLQLPYFDNIPWESINVVDENTIEIKLTQQFMPLYNYLSLRSFSMYNPEFVKTHTEDDLKNQVSGTGPFLIKSYLPNEYIYLEKNPNYWQEGKPYLDKIDLLIVADSNTRFFMLESGEADFVRDISFIEEEELASYEDIATETAIATNAFHYSLHNQYPPLNIKEVRKAFNYAVDQYAMNDTIFGGRLRIADEFFTTIPGMSGYHPQEPYPYDPEKAMEIFDKYNFVDTNGDGYRDWNGKDRIFTLFTRKGRKYGDIEMAEQLQAMLDAVGVKVQIEILDSANYFTVLNQPFGKAPYYDMSLQSPGNFTADKEYPLTSFVGCDAWPGKLYNYSHYCNEELDKLVAEGNRQTTIEERNKYYDQATEIFWDDAPAIFLFDSWLSVGYKNNLKGFYPNGANNMWQIKFAWWD